MENIDGLLNSLNAIEVPIRMNNPGHADYIRRAQMVIRQLQEENEALQHSYTELAKRIGKKGE